MPEIPGHMPIDCGSCGAHFQLDPSGDIAGAACPECGGTRFFRSQPSPTRSDGTLRDMVDSDSQKDQGGNPLGEGTIMGNDGEKPAGLRDNYTHSKVAHDWVGPDDPDHVLNQSQPEREPMPHALTEATGRLPCRDCGTELVDNDDPKRYYNPDSFPPLMCPNCNRLYMNSEVTPPNTVPAHWGHVANLPSEQYIQAPSTQTCPLCEAPFHDKEGYTHHVMTQHPESYGQSLSEAVPPNGTQAVAKRVEMRTLDMEPYAPLWDESYIPAKTAGPLMEMAAPLAEGAAGLGGGLLKKALPFALPSLMKGALGMGGGGQQAGGMAPEAPTPAPSMEMLGSSDIPFILVADLETPHSVKTVDEQHDDPEKQDQKEFNDGDDSPSNMQNPNNDDSGANGEDGVREKTDGYGLGENSPGVERAMMILPLLMHYFESEDSGQSDPLIRGLHDALEQESPGYIDQEHPDGEHYVQLVMQHHKQPHQVQAGVNAFTGELPGASQQPNTTCPSCGGILAGDGSCPQCGNKSGTQWGVQPAQATGMGNGMPTGGASYPPGHVANGQGPINAEQIKAMTDALKMKGMSELVPQMLQDPSSWGWLLNDIQNVKNSPPLVDPSQAQPQPPPMGGQMNPPGAMPVMDPSQPGGGGGMPMQPMSKQADMYGRDTAWPRELPAPRNQNEFHYMEPGESAMGVGELGLGKCPQCGGQSLTPYNGMCQQCGFAMPKDAQDVALPQHDPQGPYTLAPGEMDEGMLKPHWGKQADANNAIPRCPKCNTATTTYTDGVDGSGERKGRCHSPGCGHVFPLKDAHVVLADLPNPVLQNAGEQHEQRPEEGQDSSMTWQDAQGRPLIVGQVYSLASPGYEIPDEVKVVSKKPDQLGLKTVGQVSNLNSGDDSSPDFLISPQDVQVKKYTFTPSNEMNGPDPNQPVDGMPGMDQIPQSGQTTDEASNSYPNPGTVSHVLATENVEDPEFDDLCHKCGCTWVTHTASSATRMMHECSRCGTAWETEDQSEGRQSSVDLSWLNENSQADGFHEQMERARSMAEYGQQSRSLSTIAAKDDRLQAVRDVLSHNRSERERTAGRHFTPGEQRGLVNERGTARNADLMDLEGTHYTTRWDASGKANGLNAPDEHLVLGL